ncbi:hypothetical protein JZ751_001499 [Albula glossodonta]|uniref:Uncharacterized protein n=1 Tax=Albula glossodonta TaxID=121402 RepID=A0A8T2PU42_9TELE|nr:hypothetical protein JZ751_001499 [Albula glossodonta]
MMEGDHTGSSVPMVSPFSLCPCDTRWPPRQPPGSMPAGGSRKQSSTFHRATNEPWDASARKRHHCSPRPLTGTAATAIEQQHKQSTPLATLACTAELFSVGRRTLWEKHALCHPPTTLPDGEHPFKALAGAERAPGHGPQIYSSPDSSPSLHQKTNSSPQQHRMPHHHPRAPVRKSSVAYPLGAAGCYQQDRQITFPTPLHALVRPWVISICLMTSLNLPIPTWTIKSFLVFKRGRGYRDAAEWFNTWVWVGQGKRVEDLRSNLISTIVPGAFLGLTELRKLSVDQTCLCDWFTQNQAAPNRASDQLSDPELLLSCAQPGHVVVEPYSKPEPDACSSPHHAH